MALTATGRPIGLLHIWGAGLSRHDQELLHTFANHMALALERAQLREQALRTELLEEVDRLQRALVSAVSHDLRTPLATIKASASTLRNADAAVARTDREELLELIDNQTDRLDRLVTNLLDLSRVQAGALELHNQPIAVGDLVTDAVAWPRVRGRRLATSRWRSTTISRSSTWITCSSARCSPISSTTPSATPRRTQPSRCRPGVVTTGSCS